VRPSGSARSMPSPEASQYEDLEAIDFYLSFAEMRGKPRPPHRMPIVVLSREWGFGAPPGVSWGFARLVNRVWKRAQAKLASLEPGVKHLTAFGSGHQINVRRPGVGGADGWPSRARGAPMKGKLMAPLITAALALVPLGCGADTSTADHRQALEDYVAKVQPIRLGINELLDRADPILEGYRDGDLGVAQAGLRLGRIERGVAGYAVRIAALELVPAEMRAAQDAYAHTFVLQDTYLSALVAALRERDFEDLPRFQNEQRAAIIAWRTRLQVLADRWGATLPANLQVAGRGEISPSPTGD
jgi:hypothetical protein